MIINILEHKREKRDVEKQEINNAHQAGKKHELNIAF
jgi:hypothetical protein